MKICLISSFFPPFFFGGEKNLEWVAKRLAQREHQIVVITTSPNRGSYVEEMNGVKIYRFFPLNLYPPYQFQNKPMLIRPLYHVIDLWNPHSYRVIKGILGRERPNVVHIHNFKGLSLSAFSAAKSLQMPLLFTLNDYSLICPRATLLKPSGKICYSPRKLCQVYAGVQKRLINGKVDFLIAPAQFAIDRVKATGLFVGINALRLFVGLELNSVQVERNYDVIDVLYVGGMNKAKGVHILINAFKKLEQDNARLHIVGKGQDTEEMKRLAGDNLKIIFHGFVPEEELAELRQMANISVVPSIWYDNAPGVIYESFSFGIPVIGSRIGGIPELIEDGYNGFLFKPGDVDDLSRTLKRALSDIELLKKLGENAKKSAQKYNLDSHIDSLLKVYEEVL